MLHMSALNSFAGFLFPHIIPQTDLLTIFEMPLLVIADDCVKEL